jgi:hypothetical protein
MEGVRILIDLTGPVANEADDVLADALAGPLADNFLAPSPPHRQDAALKREYRLPDAAISDRFKEQCIRFGEWRQRVYEWSRDGSSVARSTTTSLICSCLRATPPHTRSFGTACTLLLPLRCRCSARWSACSLSRWVTSAG